MVFGRIVITFDAFYDEGRARSEIRYDIFALSEPRNNHLVYASHYLIYSGHVVDQGPFAGAPVSEESSTGVLNHPAFGVLERRPKYISIRRET